MENKQIEAQVGKVLSFKPQVGKVQMGQSTGGFISNFSKHQTLDTHVNQTQI